MVDGREIAAQFEDAADFETRKVLCGGQLLTVLFLDGLTSGILPSRSCARWRR